MNQRLHIIIRGAVQGVGFRPFIYKIASELNLLGYVKNTSNGVYIEVEGPKLKLDSFLLRIPKAKPTRSTITGMEHKYLDPIGYDSFQIIKSSDNSSKNTIILPDIAECRDCLKEMFDKNDRRYLYPFINCTNCGPRFSIIESLPYDRPNTSMKSFDMCDECKEEYEDPTDRRFHAQPIACPNCGPQVTLCDNLNNILASANDAIKKCIELIRNGSIVAVKGLGGYQLVCDATNKDKVALLRLRKNREEKPFAVMFPNIDSVKQICEVSAKEESILLSPESPIVLLKKKANVCSKYFVSEECSPGNPYLGVMLPYTPLHHILLKQLDSPIVATSGNIAEEPMCIDDEDALNRLKDIADYFLINNRPIVRHVDDSIVRVVADREMVTRRARGYAPYPIKIKNKIKNKMIAVGGHLKNTIAMNIDENIFISQHIGNLETSSSMDAFRNVINDFKDMYEFNPDLIIHDIHPEYLSTKYAQSLNKNILSVQHHFAHIASCMAENEIDTECLGVSWDGTGLGFDNNIWGGEFFIVDKDFSYSHAAQFRTFKLPGGEAAIKEARRSALGILYEIYDNGLFEDFNYLINKNFSVSEIKIISSMLLKNINCPTTSSAGRIFDAVSSILNISHVASYEGKSAMMLEYCVDDTVVEFYPFSINENEKLIIDWEETLLSILGDLEMGVDKSIIAAKFHNTMTRIILKVANYFQYKNVVLSGGCFQNAVLLTRTINLLTKNEYKVYWHQRVPTNDGGISLGQIVGSEYSYKDTELKKRVINSIKIGS